MPAPGSEQLPWFLHHPLIGGVPADAERQCKGTHSYRRRDDRRSLHAPALHRDVRGGRRLTYTRGQAVAPQARSDLR
jgi:hypothetical protein